MIWRWQRARAVIHSALAVLVVVALAHCMWEESRELSQWSNVLAFHRLALPSPIQVPIHDCDRESGCICRGAKLVALIDVSHCQAQPLEFLPTQQNELLAYVVDLAADREQPPNVVFPPPLFSGRQLRALYASLVI